MRTDSHLRPMPRYDVPLKVSFVVVVTLEAATPAQAAERAKVNLRPADLKLIGAEPAESHPVVQAITKKIVERQ